MQTHLLFVAAVEPYFQRYGRPLVSSLLVARKDCGHAETVVIFLVYCFQHNTLFETLALLGNVFGYASLGLGQPVRQQTCFLGHGCYNAPMKVAVLCEYSGVVRDAFIRAGHSAVSCDLLPSDSTFGPHLQGDIQSYDWSEYDLIVAHPPCTHLAVSGARYFYRKQKEQAEALDFVRWIMNLPVPLIALENPVSIISSRIRKPDQIIQPWQFGHPESKATCLWLKGLPKLEPTNILAKPASGVWRNQTPSGQNKLGPGKDRWKERSKTYLGIAEAMAAQWG